MRRSNREGPETENRRHAFRHDRHTGQSLPAFIPEKDCVKRRALTLLCGIFG